MDGDFGTELDAALNRDLAALRAAADAARTRIDAGADRGAAALPEPAYPDVDDPSPIPFEPMTRSRTGAAVSFDREEDLPDLDDPTGDLPFETSVDAEGIPMPEENF